MENNELHKVLESCGLKSHLKRGLRLMNQQAIINDVIEVKTGVFAQNLSKNS